MTRDDSTHDQDVRDLQQRLDEAEETLRAIRSGEVDALVVNGPEGEHIYTLQGADHSYRVLIEAMQQGAVSLSTDGTVLYCNRGFAEMVKRPHERIVGSAASGYLREQDRELFNLLLRQAQSGGSQGDVELQIDGRVLLPVHLALAPLALPGAVAICMVVTDLTEHNKHRDLEEVNRRKDEFLAMLAHELRNPLAPIRNAAAILRLLNHPEPQLQYAHEIIERQVQHMSRLVDDLLDVSRLSLGKVKLQWDRVELSAVVNRAVETSQPLFDERQHRLHVFLPEEPLLVRGDPIRLAQVISNLLTNAAKYTLPRGDITIRAERDGDRILIRIRDTGIGISTELLPHIFDLFIQGDRTLARSEGGLGIGLTLVRRLVEMHGGTVEASSRGLGEGSEFTVRLPAAEVRAESGGTEQRADVAPSANGVSRQILIVEDNRDGAETLALLLRSLGHDVRIAYNGLQALEIAGAYRPHAILLDIGLPGINGYEVARELRRFREFDRTVLIATSGYGQEEDKARSRSAGMQHHFVKPIDLMALQSVLVSGAK